MSAAPPRSAVVDAMIAAALQSGADPENARIVALCAVHEFRSAIYRIGQSRDLTNLQIMAMFDAVELELSDQSEAVSDVQRQLAAVKWDRGKAAQLARLALDTGGPGDFLVALMAIARSDGGRDERSDAMLTQPVTLDHTDWTR